MERCDVYVDLAGENLPALGPCRVCGESCAMVAVNVDGLTYIECGECGASTENYKTLEGAVEVWNTKLDGWNE